MTNIDKLTEEVISEVYLHLILFLSLSYVFLDSTMCSLL